MPASKPERIWELDALRGFLILCVVLVHGVFDLRYLLLPSYGSWPLFDLVQAYGGTLFVILSGLCVTLGHRSLRRGVLVLLCAMLVTLATVLLVRLGFAGEEVLIYFGVLHLLGLSMILWPLFRKLPLWALAAFGVVLTVAGYIVSGIRVECPWLFPLGFTTVGFSAGDYFPLLPHLGWFLLGAALGKTLYKQKTSLLPAFPRNCSVVRFFRFCGRHSLLIYLGHQPILYGITLLAAQAAGL